LVRLEFCTWIKLKMIKIDMFSHFYPYFITINNFKVLELVGLQIEIQFILVLF
jgi:hypothetical protein